MNVDRLLDQTVELAEEMAQIIRDIADERDALVGDPAETAGLRDMVMRWEQHYAVIGEDES